jgi:hypothetical protein
MEDSIAKLLLAMVKPGSVNPGVGPVRVDASIEEQAVGQLKLMTEAEGVTSDLEGARMGAGCVEEVVKAAVMWDVDLVIEERVTGPSKATAEKEEVTSDQRRVVEITTDAGT